MVAELFEGLAAVFALAALGLNVMATRSLFRTTELGLGQKIAQGVIVWLLPFGGALMVLRILAEGDPAAVPQRWLSNETVNEYVLQALRIEAQTAEQAAEHQMEQAIVESVSGHESHSGGHDGGH